MKKNNNTPHTKKCSQMSDKEFVEALTSLPMNEEVYKYFFYVKCRRTLKYISNKLYGDADYKMLVGEFYEFLSEGDWQIIRNYKNNSSLETYLSKCAFNHFLHKVQKENKRNEQEISISDYDLIQNEEFEDDNDQTSFLTVRNAFDLLNERDRTIIQLLVIENNKVMDVAPVVWKYINSNANYNELTTTHIQNTIAMTKQRAIKALANNYKRITNNGAMYN